ncbi:GNAT family N-acetyltransferase [Clavibacter nebraskensis]|uniref:N-acetyltransferase n=2 Tax=Clavibacter nebraskensis TaxID=31963 RepID=A0A399P5Z2_9MICO|nr:GNAT family N-acetyltransferase [Clavibacter nebraskensis]KXU20699.1 acetyltransferase [Clavibacter nebraskensis]OAH20494.1 acetyltransferase [Clavibacter nebraskensis]QGV66682.1 N-acetyltransferase [Clavibacter nebraskensis]QGV69479.1 N-acetyltransferase [Clavibacter nebraskensis]QGV72269.1 N-acetyltransferase family protein [Clavibacter nebraskensis]
MRIRPAEPRDIDDLLAIRNDAILHGTALWTEDPVDRAERERWFRETTEAGDPILVAEVDGAFAGYGTYGPWRRLSGYRFSVEDSVYVRDAFQGQGVGRALVEAVVEHARAAGKRAVFADIEARNTGSIRLHERLGFRRVGLLPGIGWKFGRPLDLAILHLPLVDDAEAQQDADGGTAR